MTSLFIFCNRGRESFSSTFPATTQTQLGTETSTSASTQTRGAVNWSWGDIEGWVAAAVVVVGSMIAGLMV